VAPNEGRRGPVAQVRAPMPPQARAQGTSDIIVPLPPIIRGSIPLISRMGVGLCVLCPTPVAKNVSTPRALTERIKMCDQLSRLANCLRQPPEGASSTPY
jgi:hypothetical protein